MQLDEKKIQFTMIGIGLWEATGPNCEEVKRSILYPRSKPMGWKTQTYKFLSLCSEKHKHTSALIQVWRQFLHTFMANYSSWTIDFILLAHYWINSKYYKQVNFFKIWLKKKKKQMNYGVVYGTGWVWGIFQPNQPLRIEKSPTLRSYKNNVM